MKAIAFVLSLPVTKVLKKVYTITVTSGRVLVPS